VERQTMLGRMERVYINRRLKNGTNISQSTSTLLLFVFAALGCKVCTKW
jgi:hypothetical protein